MNKSLLDLGVAWAIAPIRWRSFLIPGGSFLG